MKQQTSTPERQKISKPSQLLSQEENEQLFGLLGRKCQSMCTSVVQVYKTDGSAHAHWKKRHTGALCFVKDSSKRSYFMRVFCLIKNEMMWEHELYDNIKISRPRPYLLTFEGEDGHIALNFASEEECEAYFRISDLTVENRSRKRQERKNRPKNAPAIPSSQQIDNEDPSKVILRNNPKMAAIPLASNLNTSQLKPSLITTSSSREKKRGQRKYTKADISKPTNFVHLNHVGWDAQKGFDLTGSDDDEMLKHFFNKAGVSQQQLNDRDTREYIYDFITSNNVLASLKSEQVENPKAPAPAPPPVPSRQPAQNGTQRTAPPPPPTRQPPPPLPSTTPPTRGPPPSRPPPIITTNNLSAQAPSIPPPPPPPQPTVAPPPPPPPPPMPQESVTNNSEVKSSLPIVSDTRSALMESIRKGTTLKKVDPATLSTSSGDSRSDLMSEIRQGIELRPAASRELPAATNRNSDSGAGTDALADALRRALQERGRVIQSSDENSDESSDNDGEWED